MSGGKPVVSVRFPPDLAAAARQLAGHDGMNLSAWVRKLLGTEVGRRDGKCPACGQEVHADADVAGGTGTPGGTTPKEIP